MLENILKRANLIDVLVILIASAATFGFWRGTWNLLDKFLLPNHFFWSQIISISAGIVILVVLSRYN